MQIDENNIGNEYKDTGIAWATYYPRIYIYVP